VGLGDECKQEEVGGKGSPLVRGATSVENLGHATEGAFKRGEDRRRGRLRRIAASWRRAPDGYIIPRSARRTCAWLIREPLWSVDAISPQSRPAIAEAQPHDDVAPHSHTPQSSAGCSYQDSPQPEQQYAPEGPHPSRRDAPMECGIVIGPREDRRPPSSKLHTKTRKLSSRALRNARSRRETSGSATDIGNRCYRRHRCCRTKHCLKAEGESVWGRDSREGAFSTVRR
jgi:hypothetical protein